LALEGALQWFGLTHFRLKRKTTGGIGLRVRVRANQKVLGYHGGGKGLPLTLEGALQGFGFTHLRLKRKTTGGIGLRFRVRANQKVLG